MNYFVGVDMGGTTTTVGIGTDEREIVYLSEQFETRSAAGPPATAQTIAAEIARGLRQIEARPERVMTVGLSTPGPATLDGVLLRSPNLDPTLWDNCNIRLALQDALQPLIPDAVVHYIGDGQSAALGEFSIRTGKWRWPSGPAVEPQELSSLAMVIVGTGLGGGEVRNSQVVRGAAGRAGHFGHLTLPHYAFRYEHDRQLRVGNALCTVESAVSLTGLTHQLEHRLSLDKWHDHPLRDVPGSFRNKAKLLRKMAAERDALALELFEGQAEALGIGLLNVNYVGDFDMLVIGGGVCDLADDVRERYRVVAEAAYRRYALDGFRDVNRFEFSACGDEAPVIGAICHAFHEIESASYGTSGSRQAEIELELDPRR